MNWTLEVVCIPVTDVDRAKAFYAEQLGFQVDHDTSVSEDVRIVQLTPLLALQPMAPTSLPSPLDPARRPTTPRVWRPSAPC